MREYSPPPLFNSEDFPKKSNIVWGFRYLPITLRPPSPHPFNALHTSRLLGLYPKLLLGTWRKLLYPPQRRVARRSDIPQSVNANGWESTCTSRGCR